MYETHLIRLVPVCVGKTKLSKENSFYTQKKKKKKKKKKIKLMRMIMKVPTSKPCFWP
jgi:hypothetical protein